MNIYDKKRAILITGCSTGIGYESALCLHKRGYQVIASARKQSDVEMLKAAGLCAICIDTSIESSVKNGFSEALELTNGKLFSVFHNAGYGQSGALEDLPVLAVREQFEANVFGAHQINTLAIPLMRMAGEGRIIWNSSVLGFVALKYRGAYNASKFAIEGMADTLRIELQGSGIAVSIIQPGPISTDFRKNSLKAFLKYIDIKKSVHFDSYLSFTERLKFVGDTSKFTLPPSSILNPLIHAIESNKPKTRYRVTTPTKFMAIAKRILPDSMIDKIVENGL